MIESKDLRIGNYVNHSVMGIVRVCKISRTTFKVSHDYDNLFETADEEDCKPIELTTEILLKCGFEKSLHPKLDKNCWSKNYGSVEIIISNKIFFDVYTKYNPSNEVREFNYNFITTNNGINHLHQLQNLFQTLTGKELKVNL